ncbi:hypothetical protein [Halobacillus litoralis]|uniref:Uncharacterized protein n=1 Tax=Halobacillus litoralis TaxID=45668 RepID=A0A410MAQ8_9BACI|nr:hypothetical protein [Halobacillus litoralis]QAS51756.1 hypothetical protein HLI_05675 [Halobacillus litoralis]
MKKIRLAIFSLIALIIIVCFFYLDNRELNRLTNDQIYPMVEEPNQHPQPLTEGKLEIGDEGVHLTKLYSRNTSKGLYFGMWYGKGNNLMNNEEKKWKRKKGQIEFLVKAVDSNGTTYDGRTVGLVAGTFSVFQYVQFDGFHYDQDLEELTLFFYPMIAEGDEATPNAQAWLETTIPVE